MSDLFELLIMLSVILFLWFRTCYPDYDWRERR